MNWPPRVKEMDEYQNMANRRNMHRDYEAVLVCVQIRGW